MSVAKAYGVDPRQVHVVKAKQGSVELECIIDTMNNYNRSNNKLIEDSEEARRVIAENFG